MSDFNLGDKPPSKNSSTMSDKPPKKTLSLSIPETHNEPQSQNPDLTPPIGGSNPDAAPLPDFDNAPLPDDETTPAAPIGEGSEGKITATGRMTYEVFDQTFCAIFSVSGHVTGFQTLVKATDQPTRPDATRAMYETILDTPALHFLVEPSGLWMQRALAIGAFAVPVVLGVAGEMRAKQNPVAAAPLAGAPPQNDERAMRASLKGKKND